MSGAEKAKIDAQVNYRISILASSQVQTWLENIKILFRFYRFLHPVRIWVIENREKMSNCDAHLDIKLLWEKKKKMWYFKKKHLQTKKNN